MGDKIINSRNFILMILIYFLVYLGTIFMTFDSARHLKLQVLVFLILIVAGFMVLYGINNDEMWTWQLSTLMFVVVMFNLINLEYSARNIPVFTISIIAAIIGFIISISNLRSYEKIKQDLYDEQAKELEFEADELEDKDQLISDQIKPIIEKEKAKIETYGLKQQAANEIEMEAYDLVDAEEKIESVKKKARKKPKKKLKKVKMPKKK